MVDLMTGIKDTVGKGFSGFMHIGGIVLPIIIGSALLIALIWWILEQKKYNKIVHVHRVGANDTRRHFFDKCKYVKNKDGVDGWKFKSLKMRANVPPDECIEMTTNGGVFAECAIDSNNQITWLAMSLHYSDWKHNKLYEPITTQSKGNYAYEQARNKRLRGAGWKDNLPLIATGITLVLLLGVFMAFYPKIQESQAKASAGLAEAANSLNQAVGKLDLVLQNQQQITDQYTPEANNLASVKAGNSLSGGGTKP
jgi:hypothetical protein